MARCIRNLARTADHCQQAQNNLSDLAVLDCPHLLSAMPASLPLAGLTNLNSDRLANVLREWLKINHIKMPATDTFARIIAELIQSPPDAQPLVSWGEIEIRRYRQSLFVCKKDQLPLNAQ